MRNTLTYRLWLVLILLLLAATVLVYWVYQRKLDRIEQEIQQLEPSVSGRYGQNYPSVRMAAFGETVSAMKASKRKRR